MTKPVLGYWDTRGLAEPIRSVLHYGDIDFEDKRYSWGSTDHENIGEVLKHWAADKSALTDKFDFINVPYWIEGDFKLTQSLAILRYVSRMAGLMPDNFTPQQQASLEMVEQQANDLRQNIIQYCYGSSGLAKLRFPNYAESISGQLKPWSKFLGNKKWLMGDVLTYVDFLFYEGLDWHKLLKDDCLEEYPDLKDFYQRFKNVPKIKAYHQSDKYIRWPLVSPFALEFGFHQKK